MLLTIAAMMLAAGPPARTAQPAPAAAELTTLLDDFLAGASRNDPATHDRFWAEDVIYTGSVGRRVGKADILKDVRSAPAPTPDDPRTTFTAADVRIHQYGDSARLPRPADEARKEVASVQDAFHQAMLAADVKTLASVLDDSFIWTHRAGERMPRQQLLDRIGAGHLKYSKLETSDVTVAISGETAIVRGVSTRQRSAIPEPAGSSDAAPFTAFYTMTLVQKGGGWKAVALHTSRP